MNPDDDLQDEDFDWSDDDDPATGDSDTGTPSDDDPPTPTREQLEHQIASAEGRYKKFEEKQEAFQSSIDDLKNQLATLKPDDGGQGDDPDTPTPPEPVIPDGWNKEDWDDYKSDQPVDAELHEQQTRQVNDLKEQLQQQQKDQEAERYNQNFMKVVAGAHPDFEEIAAKNKADIEDFISSQTNPLMKSAYQKAYDSGSAEEVVHLLTDYKAVRLQDNGQARRRQKKVEDALAVTGSPPSPAVGNTGRSDPDDFDQAWDDFPDNDED